MCLSGVGWARLGVFTLNKWSSTKERSELQLHGCGPWRLLSTGDRRLGFQKSEMVRTGVCYINHDRHSVTMEALSHLNLALPTHALQPPCALLSPSLFSHWCFLAWRSMCAHCAGDLCLFSGAVCTCSPYLLDLNPLQNLSALGGSSPFDSHLFFGIVTQNTIIAMQICFGRPPTIS